MHDKYEIMLHHYLISRLSDDEKIEFERHLEDCIRCHDAIAEWEQIAPAVRDAAEVQASSLPPLRTSTRRKTMLHISPQPTRSFYQRSLTMIAAIVVLIAGAVILRVRPDFTLTGLDAPAEQITRIDVVEVVLATRHITPGEIVGEDDVISFELSTDYVPMEAVQTLDAVLGTVAKVPLICGQPIQASQIAELGDDAQHFLPNRILDTVNVCEGISFEPLAEQFDLVDIPFAVQDIAALTTLRSEMLIMRPYPAQLVPEHLQEAADFAGEMVLIPTPADTLITPFVIAETWLPNGRFIEAPRSQFLNDLNPIQFGDQLYMASLMMYVEVDDTFQQSQPDENSASASPRIVFNALANGVIYFSTPQIEQENIIIGIPENIEPTAIRWVIDAEIPLLLMHDVRMIFQRDQLIGQAILPEGTVAIAISINRLDSVAYALQEGDRVNVVFTDPDDNTPYQYEAQIVLINSVGLVTLAMKPEEATVVVEAIENGIEIALELIQAE